jgi:hypothetical protein
MTGPVPRTVSPEEMRIAAEAAAAMDVADDPGPDATKEQVSTFLSTVAMLAITIGVTWGLWPTWGPFAMCVGGVVLAALVSLSDLARRPEPAMPKPALPKPSPPGPSDPGNLHTKGPGARP